MQLSLGSHCRIMKICFLEAFLKIIFSDRLQIYCPFSDFLKCILASIQIDQYIAKTDVFRGCLVVCLAYWKSLLLITNQNAEIT